MGGHPASKEQNQSLNLCPSGSVNHCVTHLTHRTVIKTLLYMLPCSTVETCLLDLEREAKTASDLSQNRGAWQKIDSESSNP